jgi:hypothetical protein
MAGSLPMSSDYLCGMILISIHIFSSLRHARLTLGRTDLHCALALSQKPRFPPVDMPLTPAPQPLLLTTSMGFIPTRLFYALDQDRLGGRPQMDDFDRVLAEIRNLAVTMQAIRTSSIEPRENIWYSDKIYYLQRSLYEIIHRPQSEKGELDTAGSIAALIYCCNCLRDIPLSFQVIAKTVKRVKESLETFQKTPLLSQDFKLHIRLFWILGLGGVAAEGKPTERSWLVDEFRKMSELMGVRYWDSARAILEGVLWHPDLDEFGKRFWEEAMSEPGLDIWRR